MDERAAASLIASEVTFTSSDIFSSLSSKILSVDKKYCTKNSVAFVPPLLVTFASIFIVSPPSKCGATNVGADTVRSAYGWMVRVLKEALLFSLDSMIALDPSTTANTK